MTDVLIDRELLELSLNGDEQQQAKARNKLREQLAAPRQPEGEEIAWSLRSDVAGCGLVRYMTDSKYQAQTPAIKQWYEPYRCQQCSDAQRAIAELREECERLRVKLMTIASAEPGRHNIEWAKAMAATGNNEAYAKWREAFDQRDKLAGLLREARELIDRGDFREGYCMCGSGVDGHGLGDGHAPVDAGEYYAGQVRERIDAALAEVNK